MIKLGMTTTGSHIGYKYLWLVKDLRLARNIGKEKAYVVMGFRWNGDGWCTLFNGSLKECRKYMRGGVEVFSDRYGRIMEIPGE